MAARFGRPASHAGRCDGRAVARPLYSRGYAHRQTPPSPAGGPARPLDRRPAYHAAAPVLIRRGRRRVVSGWVDVSVPSINQALHRETELAMRIDFPVYASILVTTPAVRVGRIRRVARTAL